MFGKSLGRCRDQNTRPPLEQYQYSPRHNLCFIYICQSGRLLESSPSAIRKSASSISSSKLKRRKSHNRIQAAPQDTTDECLGTSLKAGFDLRSRVVSEVREGMLNPSRTALAFSATPEVESGNENDASHADS